MYNITNITSANNLYEIVNATNNLGQGLLFVMMLCILFLGFIIVFKKRDFKKVLLGSSFFMIILTAIGWGMGFIGWTYVIIPIILFGGSLIAYQFID